MQKTILVTGATGYIGGRLIPRLLEEGYKVRGMSRSMKKLEGRTWFHHPNFSALEADVLEEDALSYAMEGCDFAYYLIHSMSHSHQDFRVLDKTAATIFLKASKSSRLQRIIYLGGLGGDEKNASEHLKSRQEVADILMSGDIPCTVFRAAHILGSGSASFEILRYLAERLPFVFIPKEIITTEIQPICIRNVLKYLVDCLKKTETIQDVFDIGGPDVLTYIQLFRCFLKERSIHHKMILTPNIPPCSIGRFLGFSIAKLLLPLPRNLSGPLLEGMPVRVVAKDLRIREIIPQKLMSCKEAIDRAIEKDSKQLIDTHWTDGGVLKPPEWIYHGDETFSGGTLLQDGMKVTLDATVEEIWDVLVQIGGKNGWYHGDLLWKARGWLDHLGGGVGLKRGRRHSHFLNIGDVLDVWRVLDISEKQRLLLLAEMKLPGEALLEFKLNSVEGSGVELILAARFRPIGIWGIFYWYLMLPFHHYLFCGMLKEVAKKIDRPIIGHLKRFKPGPIY